MALRLTEFSPAGGCGCKIDPGDLDAVLAALPSLPSSRPTLTNLRGFADRDDAAIVQHPDGGTYAYSLDFSTPIVDDPEIWGGIAACNALSDLYAMGATPQLALNIVGWPSSDQISLTTLHKVLAGASKLCGEAAVLIVGGHTITLPSPIFGQSVIGLIPDPTRLMLNANARALDKVVLTKKLGTGIVGTAIKRSQLSESGAGDAISSMLQLNEYPARVAGELGVTCATDVTGFGLLGHAVEIAKASGVHIVIESNKLCGFTSALSMLERGISTDGARRNANYLRPDVTFGSVDDAQFQLSVDPQTSGGLLFTAPDPIASDLTATLLAAGVHAAMIGYVRSFTAEETAAASKRFASLV